MNYANLRKIAAATAVAMDEFGGTINVFPLMKVLYRADRQMLTDFGRTITGDNYSSMPKGPILCAAYDFVRNKSGLTNLQQRWNDAFATNENEISARGPIDRDALAEVEEQAVRAAAKEVREKMANGENVADWMHECCPEWEKVPPRSSKSLPLSRVMHFIPSLSGVAPEKVEAEMRFGEAMRTRSVLNQKPLLVQPAN